MDQTSSKLHTTVVRFLAAAFVGAIVFALTEFVPPVLSSDFSIWAQLPLAAVFALVCWIVSARAFQSAEDVLSVPRAHPQPLFAGAAAQFVSSQSPALVLLPESGTLVDVAKLMIETTPNSDGSFSITVTANGLTKREFSGDNGSLMQRVQKAPRVNWQHAVNLHDGRRRITGTIAKGVDRQRALVVLRDLQNLERYQ